MHEPESRQPNLPAQPHIGNPMLPDEFITGIPADSQKSSGLVNRKKQRQVSAYHLLQFRPWLEFVWFSFDISIHTCRLPWNESTCALGCDSARTHEGHTRAHSL
jgi:hypothetical protein